MNDDQKIIDAHHHLWDLSHLHYPWLVEEPAPVTGFDDSSFRHRNYLPSDFARDRRHQHVVMSVHVEAECDRESQVEETAWLSDMHTQFGIPNAIIGHVWLDRPDTERILLRHMEYPLFRGVRSKPRTAPTPATKTRGGPGTMDDPQWRAGFALLDKLGLIYDLRVPYYHLVEGADLAKAFPGVQIIGNHLGVLRDRSAEALATWREGMRALAAQPNVAIKISGLTVPGVAWTVGNQRGVVLETIDLFGAGRCMFASNYPVDSRVAGYDTIMNGFKEIVSDFSAAEREKLFYGNALRLYRPQA